MNWQRNENPRHDKVRAIIQLLYHQNLRWFDISYFSSLSFFRDDWYPTTIKFDPPSISLSFHSTIYSNRFSLRGRKQIPASIIPLFFYSAKVSYVLYFVINSRVGGGEINEILEILFVSIGTKQYQAQTWNGQEIDLCHERFQFFKTGLSRLVGVYFQDFFEAKFVAKVLASQIN